MLLKFKPTEFLLIDLDNLDQLNLDPAIEILIDLDHCLINILKNYNSIKPIYLIENPKRIANITINLEEYTRVTIIHINKQLALPVKILCQAYTNLDYYLIQNTISATYDHADQTTKTQYKNITIQQYTNSYSIITLLTNKHITTINRLNLTVDLLSTAANTELNILQHATQHNQDLIDLTINHYAANSYSKTTARSIVDHYATVALTGKIIVHQTAVNAQADLQTKSLILNKHAKVLSCPELIIEQKQVICTHGASVGKLDPLALLYMQTRGMDLDTAKLMLLEAFCLPIVEKINFAAIKELC